MKIPRGFPLLNGCAGNNILAAGAIVAVVFLGGCEPHTSDRYPTVEYFDFSAARSAATRWSNNESIDFGTREAREFLMSGWSVDELWAGGTSFVWAIGGSSEVRIHRFSRGNLRFRLRCRPLTGPGGPITRAVRVAVNGVHVGEVELLPGGFRTYELLIPSEFLIVGMNKVLFHYGSAPLKGTRPPGEARDLRVAWDWLKIDSRGSHPALASFVPSGDDVLILPLGTRTDFFVELRTGSRIDWEAVGVWDGESKSSLELHIDVETDAGCTRNFVIDIPNSAEFLPGDQPLPFRRTFAQISFLAVQGSGESGHAEASGIVLRSPRLVGSPNPTEVMSSSLHDAADHGPVVSDQKERLNVIVYLIDTLRADHLGTYGYSKPLSPKIDAFAADAVLFENAFAQSSWTKTSVASILTGLLPRSHGTFERDDILPPIPSYLPTLLQDLGYQTMAISASGIVAPDFGFDQGFEEFRFLEPEGDDHPVFAYSDEVTDLLIKWLSERGVSTEPFFAYVHTLDPHAPYGPPGMDDGVSAHRESELWGFRQPDEGMVNEFLLSHPEYSRSDVRDHFLELYDEDILFNDYQFGRLIDSLKDLGLYESTVIVLLSDHGEEFLDHGHWAHGRTLYSEQLHIPLIVRLPGQIEGGMRVSSVAQHIDLVPTILASVGAEIPSEVEGESLIPLIKMRSERENELGSLDNVLSYLNLDRIEIDSVLRENLHLIRWEPDQPDERLELYDLRDDPSERISLASRRPVCVGFLQTVLKASTLSPTVFHEPDHLEIEGDVEQRLRALGYIE